MNKECENDVKEDAAKVNRYTKVLDTPKAGVRCNHQSWARKYVIDPEEGNPIVIAKAGTEVVALDDDQVVTKDGEIVAPSSRFYRTVGTIDPYHIVFDMP